MGNACSSSHTESAKDVRPPSNRPKRRSSTVEGKGSVKIALDEAAAAGGGEANANALILEDDDGEDGFDEEGEEEEEEHFESDPLTPAQILRFLKMSAVSLVSVAAAFYLTRKFALRSSAAKEDWDLARQLANDSDRRMAGVESQQLASKWSPGCVDCSLKSLKTVVADDGQKNASEAAVVGAEELHKAYAAGDDFAPPRVYHNYWAANDFPSQYYSKSETIKNYRFQRIFGW